MLGDLCHSWRADSTEPTMIDEYAAADAVQAAIDRAMRALIQRDVAAPIDDLRVAAQHLMALTRTSDARKAEHECALEFLYRLDAHMGGVEDVEICRRLRILRQQISEAFPVLS